MVQATVSEALPTVRQEHLQKLESFCRALREALSRAGLELDECLEALRAALSAECTRCGIRVSGEELFALSQPPCAEHASAKIGRLRLGDCARQGCDSYFYRLTFQGHLRLDWPALLAQAEAIEAGQANEASAQTQARAGIKYWPISGLARRLGIAVIVIGLFWIARQWYQGGSIPFIHEPERFRIDPAPQEEPPEVERANDASAA